MPWRQVIYPGRTETKTAIFCSTKCQTKFRPTFMPLTHGFAKRTVEAIREFAAPCTPVHRSGRSPHGLVRLLLVTHLGAGTFRWTERGARVAEEVTGHEPTHRVFQYEQGKAL